MASRGLCQDGDLRCSRAPCRWARQGCDSLAHAWLANFLFPAQTACRPLRRETVGGTGNLALGLISSEDCGTANRGDSSLVRAVPQSVLSVPARSWSTEYVACESNPGGSACKNWACGDLDVALLSVAVRSLFSTKLEVFAK
jgi:hypothetical protein